MFYLLLLALLLAAFFFHKGVKAGAYSADRTYGGAIRSLLSRGRLK